MIERRIQAELVERISHYPAVALLGPRQVGKTTLALTIAASRPSVYLDLESSRDQAKLTDPELYLAEHEDKLVILDEVHRQPNLFSALRGLIDKGRQRGRSTGRFLLLGSASMDLLKQSGETLAGRISHAELAPFDVLEMGEGSPIHFGSAADFRDRSWRRMTHPVSCGGTISFAPTGTRYSAIRTPHPSRDPPQVLDHARAQSRRDIERRGAGTRNWCDR